MDNNCMYIDIKFEKYKPLYGDGEAYQFDTSSYHSDGVNKSFESDWLDEEYEPYYDSSEDEDNDDCDDYDDYS